MQTFHMGHEGPMQPAFERERLLGPSLLCSKSNEIERQLLPGADDYLG